MSPKDWQDFVVIAFLIGFVCAGLYSFLDWLEQYYDNQD